MPAKKMTPEERNQSAFDRAVTGVILQGQPSMRGGECRLRGCDGTKCAIGHLIKDDKKALELDEECGGALTDLVNRGEVHADLNHDLLRGLQLAHDQASRINFVPDFVDRVRKVAQQHNLNPSAIDAALAQRGAA